MINTAVIAKRLSLLLLSTSFVVGLSACDEINSFKYLKDVKSTQGDATGMMKKAKGQDESALTHDPLTVSDDIWLGNRAVRMRKGQPLDSKLEGDKGFTLVTSQAMNLNEIAAQISTTTGIPVRVGDLTLNASAGGGMAMAAPGATTTATQPMMLSYEGPLTGFLDQVAGHFDVSWRFDGQAIQVYKYETRTFTMESLPGSTAVSDGFDGGSDSSSGGSSGGASGGGGSSGSSNELKQSNTATATLDYWKELDAAVKSILAGQGTSIISPTSGTLSITATPQLMQRVADFVDAENVRLGKQVAIDVGIYDVTLTDTTDYGVKFTSAFGSSGFGLTTLPGKAIDGAGSLTFQIFKDTSSKNTATVTALSTLGNVATITHSPIITLNNRPASRKISVDQAYLASSSTTLTGGTTNAVQTSLVPGTVSTGITLQVLPRILDDGRILLQYSIKLSDLDGIVPFDSGNASVQLPTVKNRVFVQQAILQSGTTLALSGFEQDAKDATTSGIGSATAWFLGGRKADDSKNSKIVIMLTPTEITPARGTTYK